MDYSLKDLIDCNILQALCEKFSKLTQTVTAILDLDGNILVATGLQEICTKFHRLNPNTAFRCKESDTILANQLSLGRKYNIYKCKNGLVDVAVPINIDGNHVGNFFTGQFFFESPDKEYFRRQAVEFGFDENSYLKAVSRAPIFTEEQIKGTINFLCQLTEFIGSIGLKNLATLKANEALNKEIQNRQKIEKDLLNNEAQLSNALKIAKLGYWEYDIADELFTFNDYFFKIFRTAVKQVGGYKMSPANYAERFIHLEDMKVVQEEIEKAIETTDPHYSRYLEHRIIFPNAEIGFVAVRFFIVKNNQGQTVKIYGANQEITERKLVEKALLKAHDELEHRVLERTQELQKTHEQLLHSEKLAAIGNLSASIAHEFNNPLYGIQSVIEGIKRNFTLDEEYRKLSDLALSECGRIKDLIKGLQDFNKPSAGVKEVVDIHALLDEVLTMIKKVYKTANITIIKQYASDLPGLQVIPDQIKQVLLNILTNAKDAIVDKNGEVTVMTENLGSKIAIRIKDTGNGISDADLPAIFEPFFTTKSVKKGTGLGLSISYGIIRGHGGDIKVDSILTQGSTVSILLPININI